LIEQGKVDRLLQAGAKDRRAIFEEAAGISRFKAKKIEAERRLERVEANLTRLADIVEEVGSRYRAIKTQAAKAARYREYTQRLQQLRTYVGVKDYRSFSDKLSANEAQLDQIRRTAESLQASIAELQAQAAGHESRLDASAADVSGLQEQVSNLREAIAQAESSAELNRQRRADIQQRQQQLASQLKRLSERRDELQQVVSSAQSELDVAAETTTRANRELESTNARLVELAEEARKCAEQAEAARQKQQQLRTQLAELALRLSTTAAQQESSQQIHERWAREAAQLTRELGQQAEQREQLIQRRGAAEQQAAETDSALQQANQAVESLEAELVESQQNLAEQRTRFAGVSQRAKLIEEMEKRLEGVQAGTRELIQQARGSVQGPLSGVLGLVADFVQVNIQHAALVDAALGQMAQYVVLADNQLQDELSAGRFAVSGRVTLVSADQKLNLQVDPQLDLADQPEVIGPVLELVELPERHADFVRHLLTGTWIVSNLAAGRALQVRFPGRARFVTLDGEVIESDGTLVVGPKSAAAGIVSRRSELRALHAEQAELKSQIGHSESLVARLKQELNRRQAEARKLLGQNQAITAEINEITAAQEKVSFQTRTLQAQQSKADGELQALAKQLAELGAQLTRDRSEQASVERKAESCQDDLHAEQKRSAELASLRQGLEQQVTSAKVALAKAEQQLLAFETTHRAQRSSLDECLSELARLSTQSVADEAAIAEAERALEVASAQLQDLGSERERLAEQLNLLLAERSEVDRQRKALAELLHEETPEQAESRDEIDREITELRQKIGAIGAVNMQALAELEDLEQRYQLLDQQYQDLSTAKESLLKIIHKINNDSRRLFTETLEAIRINFQKLFRQTFGGGQADIVLEEGVDVLEAGVEIIATPPGKPKFSNSLLSGGEKALTAVSLLMAIFQFRPSPFCVLDEVDAPFDEANIGRFIDVLKSFLGWTKFVIVTHSKKTMTAATTLYGITMQESGVSKRVSVRFEDVSEDGRISEEAVRRTEREAAAGRPAGEGEQSAVA